MLWLLTWLTFSIITLGCWFGVVANIKNEHHGTIFSNAWLFVPDHLHAPGLKYRLTIILITPIWFLLIVYHLYG
ncbi:hypothetical protein ACFOSS_02020 [Pseudaeromonas sharmana]|uniref:Uncharacterized protein n=1 Tax=Pseudaeromonas sharmana TaxID=328412 RepID=A0ABV8CJ60_9GAMM